MHPALVIGFGAVAVDDIVHVDRPLTAGKGKVTRRDIAHGGNVATALVAVARLGGRAAFVGWLAEDEASDPTCADLTAEGVDISLAPRHPAAAPIRSRITVGSDGERFIAYDDDGLHGTSDALADDVLRQAGVLLIDGYAIHSPDVVSRARALGLAVVADIEWGDGLGTDRLMDEADHLVMPLGFTRERCGEADPVALLHRLWTPDRTAVVLTDGANGCFVRQRGDDVAWHLPAHDVRAVDTTGAGDCFHGAYAVGLARGLSPLACATYAAAAAALSVTAPGGRNGLPGDAACAALMAQPDAPVCRPMSALA